METEKKKKEMSLFLTEDLWAMILARLPIKIITTSKIVCKQWKSLAESLFFRKLFMSLHQNSHSAWSLMCRVLLSGNEVVAHYGCETWGLPRSLDSYISSFLTHRFDSQHPNIITYVEAYTHVGLILICSGEKSYVANPISRQCVEIPPPPPTLDFIFRPSGLVTQIENDVFLGYKVVLNNSKNMDVLIYSSETGLWSSKTLQSHIPLSSLKGFNAISLNGSLCWIGHNSDYGRVVVSYDFYSTGIESDRCQVTPFPDVGANSNLERVGTTSQGYIMYMNMVWQDKDDGHVEHKLRVWRLKSGEWQLVSEISPDCIEPGCDYIPLAVNPCDENTVYMLCKLHQCLASTNFHKDKFRLYNSLEPCNDDYQILSFDGDLNRMEGFYHSYFSMFVLPRWLHKIPSSPS